MGRFIWGPLLVAIERDLSISHTVAGSLFFYITIGYFLGVFFSGHLSCRLNHQRAIVLSSISCGLALIGATLAPSFIFLQMMLIAVGATAGIYLPSGIASLTYALAPRDMGKAFSVHEIAPSLAFIISPLMAELLMQWYSWRAALWPVAIGLIGLGLFYRFRRGTADFRGDPPTLRNMSAVVGQPLFWILLVLFMLGIGANVGVYAMLPLFLHVAHGMEVEQANFILAASRVAGMVAPALAGWLTDRYGARNILVVITFFSGLTTLLIGLASVNWIWLPLFLQPMLATCFFPPAFVTLTRMVSPGLRSLVVSLTVPVGMVIGGGVLPTLIGAFGDAGMFAAGFLLTGGLIMSSTLFLFLPVNWADRAH